MEADAQDGLEQLSYLWEEDSGPAPRQQKDLHDSANNDGRDNWGDDGDKSVVLPQGEELP